ncbi:21477_t:CDS:2 [Gigaspora rosea]|nr:21477_t:CDS:2 [Gigaspora rosea]
MENFTELLIYIDCGMVVDWGRNILNKLEFGSSYLSLGTN